MSGAGTYAGKPRFLVRHFYGFHPRAGAGGFDLVGHLLDGVINVQAWALLFCEPGNRHARAAFIIFGFLERRNIWMLL